MKNCSQTKRQKKTKKIVVGHLNKCEKSRNDTQPILGKRRRTQRKRKRKIRIKKKKRRKKIKKKKN